MSSYFVTGASRGIGLELVSQLSKRPADQVSVVYAAIRSSPSVQLQRLVDYSLGRIVPITVVITDRTSIKRAVVEVQSRLAGKGLDVLINNAAVMPVALDGIATMDNLRYAFEVNVEAVQDAIAAFMPLLEKGAGKQIINISSTVATITNAASFAHAPLPAYKISKAALNALTVQYALEYGMKGFTIYALTPGYLKTDSGGQGADLEVEVGVKAVLDIILSPKPEYNGTFRNIHLPGWEDVQGPNQYDGKNVPW